MVNEEMLDVSSCMWNVDLTGVLCGQYLVNGLDLHDSLTTTLGPSYREHYQDLSPEVQMRFILQAVEISCLLIARLRELQRSLDGKAPPVTPFHFANMQQSTFMALVDDHLDRFKETLVKPSGTDNRAEILRAQLQSEQLHLSQTDATTSTTKATLQDMWKNYKQQHPTLWKLACGLATIFPGDAEVERAFAELKSIYSDYRQSTCTFTLAGILACKQMKQLRKVQPPLPTEFSVVDDVGGVEDES
eukprot:GHVU01235367.1.p1 GENE.GHVU01235367.1~~GHVU01235367.1.p1  ORF type:complete len:256 (+),score=41.26 GHVU01235367.1:32-769(+)